MKTNSKKSIKSATQSPLKAKGKRGRPIGSTKRIVGVTLESLNKIFQPSTIIQIEPAFLKLIALQGMTPTEVPSAAAVETPLEMSVMDFSKSNDD